jgi:hypothetical protein
MIAVSRFVTATVTVFAWKTSQKVESVPVRTVTRESIVSLKHALLTAMKTVNALTVSVSATLSGLALAVDQGAALLAAVETVIAVKTLSASAILASRAIVVTSKLALTTAAVTEVAPLVTLWTGSALPDVSAKPRGKELTAVSLSVEAKDAVQTECVKRMATRFLVCAPMDGLVITAKKKHAPRPLSTTKSVQETEIARTVHVIARKGTSVTRVLLNLVPMTAAEMGSATLPQGNVSAMTNSLALAAKI